LDIFVLFLRYCFHQQRCLTLSAIPAVFFHCPRFRTCVLFYTGNMCVCVCVV
jgi:hypothetical protein